MPPWSGWCGREPGPSLEGLAAALEEEVNAFLGRRRYERGKPFRGYRPDEAYGAFGNGYQEPWEMTVGVGPVEVRVPRVAGVPEEVAREGGYQFRIMQRCQRASQATQSAWADAAVPGGSGDGGL